MTFARGLLTRLAICTFLTSEHGLVLIGESITKSETLKLCQKTKPGILLLANCIDGSSLVEMISYLHQSYPKMKILILVDDCDKVCVQQLISAGAVGCILKDETPQNIILAIHSAAKDEIWFSQTIVKTLVHPVIEGSIMVPKLTHREQEILGIVAEGLSNKEIAFTLQITEKTVEYHVSNILRKLQVSSRTRAALWAKEKNIQGNISVKN